jgi:hypothetical protein
MVASVARCIGVACAAIVAGLPLVNGMLATQSITYLGPLSNAAPPYLPLGAFHLTSINPHAGKKPQVIFLGTQIDDSSAIERWAVVKSLGQFGTFSKIRPLTTRYCVATTPPPNGSAPQQPKIDCGHPFQCVFCKVQRGGAASFDLPASKYDSRFVSLAPAELIDRNFKTMAPGDLNASQLALFNRYSRIPGYRAWHDEVWHAVPQLYGMSIENVTQHLPVVAVGGYVDVGANVAFGTDLLTSDRSRYLSFTQVLKVLQTGKAAAPAPDTLVPDVNAEANVVTALICHVDGRKPSKVCDRTVIRSMLKHVK